MMVGTVGLGAAVEVVALDDAGEALALGGAGHVDQVARGEESAIASTWPTSNLEAVDAELADGLTLGRPLSGPPRACSASSPRRAELDGRVAILRGGPELGHGVRADRDDRDGTMCRRPRRSGSCRACGRSGRCSGRHHILISMSTPAASESASAHRPSSTWGRGCRSAACACGSRTARGSPCR